MKNILIYGHGNMYEYLMRIINTDECRINGIVETEPQCKEYNDIPVYKPAEIINLKFDYIVTASVQEYQMRDALINNGIPQEKIISYNPNSENVMQNAWLFDTEKLSICLSQTIKQNLNEIISYNRFASYLHGVKWLNDLSVTAGGMAVGYDYLYCLTRILNIIKPTDILEMGLGQTSRILSRYYNHYESSYDIIENDRQWYEFVKKEEELPNGINVHIIPTKTVSLENYETNALRYEDISPVVKNRKFQFISIDGPRGSERMSRTDILDYIPDCLADSFCIMLDDYQRVGEKDMIDAMTSILNENGIKYCQHVYGVDKEFCVTCSSDLYFLTTMFN